MKITYDKVADAVYMRISNGAIAQSAKLDDTIYVDKDAQDNILGFEILNASAREDFADVLKGSVGMSVPVSIISGTPMLA